MNENFKNMESSASGDSDKGSCTEALQIEATGRDSPDLGERPSPSNLSSKNLEGLTEKIDTLGLRVTSKNRCGTAKKQVRRARLTGANLGLLQAVSHKLCRSPVHPGSRGVNLQRVEGFQWAQASNSSRLGALPRGGG